MNYYKIDKALDPKIVGQSYDDSETMSKDYNYGAPDSVYNWRKNNVLPNLNSVIINKKAKIAHLIKCVPIGGSGTIISELLFEVFSLFHLMDYNTLDVTLLKSGKEIPGFLFFYFNRRIEDQDVVFSKTEYVDIEMDRNKGEFYETGLVKISSFKDLDQNRPVSKMRPVLKKLTLRQDFKFDVFCLDHYGQLIVTEAVKNACIEQDIKGIRFDPFPELVRE